MMDLSGLPGEELITKGMQDLGNGHVNTPEALLVAMACTKLESLGLEVHALAHGIEEPELKLYKLLGQSHHDAFKEYKAFRNRLGRFERALEARISRAHHTASIA